MNASTAMAATYAMVDGWCEAAVGEIGQVCKVGCSHCCRILVTVSLPEAMVILDSKEGRRLYDEKRLDIAKDSAKFFAHDPVTKVGPWSEQRKACPFLEEDRCSIYRVRPVNCRTHLAARKCEPYQDGNFYVDVKETQFAAYASGIRAAAALGVPYLYGPMQVMLEIAHALEERGLEGVAKSFGVWVLDPYRFIPYWGWCEL